jgi:hypothetical protein
MKHFRQGFIALMATLSVVAMTSGASAQSTAAREATIHKCMLEAVKQYPRGGGDETNDAARTALYKACMAAAGLAP